MVANTFISLLSQNGRLLAQYVSTLGLSPESYIRRQAAFQAQNRRRALQGLTRSLIQGETLSSDDLPIVEKTASSHPTAEEQLLQQHQLLSLIAELEARLSPAIMLTFQLLYEEECTPAEVAKALGISLDLVYARKKRIADALQALLQPSNAVRRDA